MTPALSPSRRLTNGFMLSLAAACTALVLGILFFILGYIAYHGISALDWDFFTKLPKPVGEKGGGMANAIVGTVKLLALASLIGVPIGFFGGVYLSEYGRKNIFGFLIRYAADLLNGIPSIVMGIFAYTIVV